MNVKEIRETVWVVLKLKDGRQIIIKPNKGQVKTVEGIDKGISYLTLLVGIDEWYDAGETPSGFV